MPTPKNDDRASLEKLKHAIEDVIKQECRSDEVHRLLMLSVGRVWFNHHSRLGRAVSPDEIQDMMEYHRQLLHIADWLEASVLNNADWLQSTDKHGRPKKLMKFGSLDQIVKEADKAMLKAAQKGFSVQLSQRDERLEAELQGGFFIVELMSTKALDRESAYMQHCIGNGAYDGMLKNDNHRFLSLRDRFNKPHATMHIARMKNVAISNKTEKPGYKLFADDALVDGYYWNLEQLQGKQNKPPLDKYYEVLVPYLMEMAIAVRRSSNRVPYVADRQLNMHRLSEMPDVIDIVHFNASMEDQGKPIPLKLPRQFKNTRKIELDRAKVDCFPEINPGKVDKISLSSCHVEKFMPNSLSGENLVLFLTHLTAGEMPETIECRRALINFKSVGTFPRSIKANSDLSLTQIQNVNCYMEIEAPSVTLGFDKSKDALQKASEGNDRSRKSRPFVRTKTLNVFPDADGNIDIDAETECLLISMPHDFKGKVKIPETIHVITSIKFRKKCEINQVTFPDTLSDRILIGTIHEAIHLGDYRKDKMACFKPSTQ